MSLFNDAQQKSKTIGQWQPHPLGRFNAAVVGIKAGEYEGRKLYELKLQTSEGELKQTVWETWESEVQGRLLHVAKGDAAKAKQLYTDGMARTLQLYDVFGLPQPQTEAAVYTSLGGMVGKQCVAEVKANPKDDKRPYVNLYPPNADGNPNAPVPAAQEQMPTTAFGGPAPDLDSIPFIYRQDLA